jgi:hypothetical protein
MIPSLFDPEADLSGRLGFIVLASLFTFIAGLFFGALLGSVGGFFLGIPHGLMLALLDGRAIRSSLHPKAYRALAAISSIAITILFIYLLSTLMSIPKRNDWLIYLGIPGLIAAIAFVRISWTTIAWADAQRHLTA